jgi:clan AA aspartic protease
MGTFHVSVEIGDPRGERYERVEALVDTGASDTVVPRRILERLGVQPEERWPYRLANGQRIEYDASQTFIRLDGRTRVANVVFGEEDTDALLGASTLEVFHLAVDPVSRQLVSVDGLLK